MSRFCGRWGYEYDPGTNVVDVYVGYLCRKLRGGQPVVVGAQPGAADEQVESSASREGPIVTVRSVGYRFDAPN